MVTAAVIAKAKSEAIRSGQLRIINLFLLTLRPPGLSFQARLCYRDAFPKSASRFLNSAANGLIFANRVSLRILHSIYQSYPNFYGHNPIKDCFRQNLRFLSAYFENANLRRGMVLCIAGTLPAIILSGITAR